MAAKWRPISVKRNLKIEANYVHVVVSECRLLYRVVVHEIPRGHFLHFILLVTLVVITLSTTKPLVGCVAQLAERWSLTGELTLSCARPAAGG